MVSGLASKPEFETTFFVPSDHWKLDRACASGDPLFEVQSRHIPYSRRHLLSSSLLFDLPKVESYSGLVDWVYSPREIYVPTAHALSAVTIHDVYTFESLAKTSRCDAKVLLRRALWRKAVERSTVVLTVSEFSKHRICEILGAKPERVHVIGNGVDEIFFRMANEDILDVTPLRDHKYYLSVGGVSEKKGALRILSFADRLRKLAVNSRLVVIGPVEAQFRNSVACAPNIIVVGRGLDDLAIARWIRGATAVILLSEYEGFGIPALEAMAAGTPVIAHCATALPEVVGDAGLLIDGNSVSSLDDAVGLQFDENYRSDLVARGFHRVQQFSWNACVDRLVEIMTCPYG